MADTSESDGVENRVPDHDSSVSSRLPDDDLSKRTAVSEMDTSVTTSLSKRIKMDGDGDGAPSSSEASPRHQKGTGEHTNGGGDGGRESVISFDSSAESTPRRGAGKSRSTPSTPQASVRGQDLSMVDMKTSWDGSAASGGSTKGETTDGETGYKIPFKHRAGMLADPVKIAKEREKEERVRQARERLKEERQKKLEELKEQQRIAQENREKQLEMRRKKIEDLRRRDSERRAAVEERRKMKEEVERARRESILQKAEERVARYEAWKAGGRKGGRGHVLGFGSATPRDICQPFERPRRSSSHSALQRRSPNGSDMDSMRPQRRALSACSAVRRHCCVDINRIGTSTPAAAAAYHHYQRPANAPVVGNPLTRASMTASMPSPVRMRENKSARKQRPASVASSMPSFVGGEPAKSPRSKSTDRTGRDRSKTRPSRKDEKAVKDKENQSEKAQKKEEKEKEEEEKDEGDGGEKKEKKTRVSMSFFDRLSTPKFSSKKDGDSTPRETPPKKDAPIIRLSPRKAYSTTNLAMMKKRTSMRGEKPSPTHTKDATPKHTPAKDSHRGTTTPVSGPATPAVPSTAGRSISPGRKHTDKTAARTASPSRKGGDKSGTSTPRVTPPPSSTSTPTHGPTAPTPSSAAAPASAGATPSTAPGTPATPATLADDGTTAPRAMAGSSQDITAEEYKARLAEKRRQAREKAEREAEEERKRQEEERLAEEEQQRKEEEEQRRLEEEALRLAEEARRAEGERLQKAIEAEEKRKKEEAERLEQEKKAKEEADRKAKEEAERLEKEKQVKAKKEEEERLERKKKLEMIMKRVKPDSSAADKTESPTKPVSSSPNLSQLSSSQNSPEEHEKAVVSSHEDSEGETSVPAPMEGSAVEPISSAMTMSFHQDWVEQDTSESSSMSSSTTVIRSMSSGDILDGPSSQDHGERGSTERLSSSAATTPSKVEEKTPSSEPTSETKSKFKSPLLQQLVENKGGDSPSGGPKFKSPLLQNLLGKTKVGARMGLSASMGDLSQNKDSTSSTGQSGSAADTSMTVSASSAVNNGSSKEIFKQGRDDEDKDEDTSIHDRVGGSPKSFENKHAVTNGITRDLGDAGDTSFPTSTSKSSLDSSPPDATRLPMSMMSDSALGSSIEPHGDGEMSAPGMMSQSIIFNGHGDHKSHGMEDSSISLHSVTESVTNTASVIPFETVAESERQEDGAPPTQGDGQFEELIDLIDTTGKNNSIVGGTPIIAFEENNRRSDVTESLS